MAERNWTEEQKNAIEGRNGTVVVSAAAGSGKTSVLVERIVRRLTDEKDPVSPDGLLVVTFTNAAASEMRVRIESRLRELRSDPDKRETVRRILPRLDEMQVGTMDACCMRLVREQHHLAGVEPDFGVMEEGEETALKYAVAADVIDALYAEGDEDFRVLSRLFAKGRDDAELLRGVVYLSDYSMSEPRPERWLSDVGRHFLPGKAGESVWGKTLLSHFASACDYCRLLLNEALSDVSHDEALSDKLSPVLILMRDRVEEFAAAAEKGDWDLVGAAMDAAILASRERFSAPRAFTNDPGKLAAAAKKNEVKTVLSGLSSLYPATEAEHAGDVEALSPAASALIGAVGRFNAELLRRKREKNLFGFADIVHFAENLLCDPTAPDGKTDLARELTEGFSEIMIDEYQDTNRVQDDIFTALSKNGENLFLVGDVKQSIYRFRLASPEIFLDRVRSYPYYQKGSGEKKEKIILGKNFRSRAGVTGLVNFFFEALMNRELGELDYSDDERLYPAADWYPPTDAPDAEFHCVLPDLTSRNAAAREADYVAALIRERVESGAPVTDRNGALRKAAYGDFCILLRSAKSVSAVYAAALRKAGVPVILDSKEGFFETAEIRMALSFLRAVDNPLRDVDLLAYLLSPVGGFVPAEVSRLRRLADAEFGKKPRAPLWTALNLASDNGGEKAKEAVSCLLRFKRLAAAASAAEVVSAILDETPILACAGAMSEGYLRVANLRALYEASLGFCADGEKTLVSFVRYLERLRENGARMPRGNAGEGGNSVKIMTMHRSKGLEFPFVIVAGLTRRFNLGSPSSTLFVSHEQGVGFKRREPEKIKFYDTLSSAALKIAARRRDLSEEMRIYYVAFTRAKEKLILVASPDKWDERVQEAERLLSGAEKIPAFYSLTCGDPLGWFLPILLRHPDVGRAAGVSHLPEAPFRLAFFSEEAPEPSGEEAPDVPAAPDPALVEAFSANMRGTYKYLPVANAPALHTASHLRDEKFSAEFFGKSVPAFLFDKGMSPADVGTATHRFLQFAPFVPGVPDVPAVAAALVEAGRLTPAQREVIDLRSVEAFFSSPFYRRILKAQKVLKEQSFNTLRPVRDFDPFLPEEFAAEQAVVIGKIDLLLVEDGKAVIVDYKTDRVRALSELRRRYSDQLDLYSDAVKSVLGLEVKEKVLYSLTLRDFISWT